VSQQPAARQPRDPPWERDELILLCEALRQNGWKQIRASDPRAIELSETLRALPLHPLRTPKFRSPSSVQRKGADILTQLPAYQGRPTRGGRLDAKVLAEFLSDPGSMSSTARAISVVRDERLVEPIEGPGAEDVEYEAPEGRLLYRRHLVYERSRRLRLERVEAAKRAHHRLECEACGFDFARIYGSVGEGYIQVHHIVPLHQTGETKSGPSDLALLCANCHAMAHRIRPWPSVPDLRALIIGP
jgi:5-methylcytosine-specific restriction protein A